MRLRTLFVVGLTAAAIVTAAFVPAAGSSNLPPLLPGKYSGALAKDILLRHYTAAWAYLSPMDQQVITEDKWIACQRKNPVASADVKLKTISAAGTVKFPSPLPGLGTVTLQDVTIQVVFTSKASKSPQVALEYAFWLKQHGKWVAVWLPDTYSSYKTGKCGVVDGMHGLY